MFSLSKSIDVSPSSNQNRFRKSRIELLRKLIDEVLRASPSCRIIDVGGTRGFWATWESSFDFARTSVTCVNIDPSHSDYGPDNSAVTVRQGTACDLSFAGDGEFDIAFSNSVIEHVGLWSNMERMAGEIRRVSRSYVVQTPYFWFPIEPHARTPFIHWLPDSLKYRVLLHRRCGYWEQQDTVSGAVRRVQSAIMLDIRQMCELFPDAEIRKERFAGLVKSIIAVREARR